MPLSLEPRSASSPTETAGCPPATSGHRHTRRQPAAEQRTFGHGIGAADLCQSLPGRTRGIDFVVLFFLARCARDLGGGLFGRLVGAGLATVDDKGCTVAHISDRELARQTHIDRHTIPRAIARLAKCGMLQVRRRAPGRSGSDPAASGTLYVLRPGIARALLGGGVEPAAITIDAESGTPAAISGRGAFALPNRSGDAIGAPCANLRSNIGTPAATSGHREVPDAVQPCSTSGTPYANSAGEIGAPAVNHLSDRGQAVFFPTAPDLLALVRTGFDKGDSETHVQLCQRVSWLVIHDLGVERLTAWASEIWFCILNARYNSRCATLIAGNVAPQDLGDDRLASRFGDPSVCLVVPNGARDYRPRKALSQTPQRRAP